MQIVIIANSARMLAQAAKNSGYSPLTIDCFADLDTQTVALDCIRVKTLALDSLQSALSSLKIRYSNLYIIYGSGFEYHQHSLEYLHQHFKVLGNTAEVFSETQNKPSFFSKLKQLQITYPETLFIRPDNSDGWLTKPLQGDGGVGIKKYQYNIEQLSSCYWQKRITGKAMSVLFLANGVDFEVVGFHKQVTTTINNQPFIFSAIISQPDTDGRVQKVVTAWLAKIVAEFNLFGLNSLDFMVDNNQCFVLEVNARPSASMQLYNSHLISAHINVFHSGTLDRQPPLNCYQAYQICYAETDLIINKSINWPQWVVDIPDANTLIHTSSPICSIIAGGKTEQQVVDLLRSRKQQLTKLLYR